MDAQKIPVHCTYSDEGTDISSIVLESFRFFLQTELQTMDTPGFDDSTAKR